MTRKIKDIKQHKAYEQPLVDNFSSFLQTDRAKRNIKKRHRKEARFKRMGIIAISISITFLAILILNISIQSKGAFTQTVVKTSIYLDQDIIFKNEQISTRNSDYKQIFINSLKDDFPKISADRRLKIKTVRFFSNDTSSTIKEFALSNPDLIGSNVTIWLKTNSVIDQYIKSHIESIDPYYKKLITTKFANDNLKKKFSFTLLSNGDSTYPELAGILTALLGSFYTMMISLLVSFPLAVLLALYLEEFAPKNKFTDFIEININNLAAIPSVIFGLLGLAIFITIFGVPRSSSLIGGITLSLLVLPTIVIATRNSIKSIPQTIKDAALALGSSSIQVALQHTLPLALPGILTGTILAITRAIGETAPLLMIGMIAFIVDKPSNIIEPTTVLPVQIYLWSNNPETGFAEKTAATILILLLFLVLFNLLAIFLRNKYSKRW